MIKPPYHPPASLAHLSPEQRFFNRELSLLAFHRRVLEEAENTHNPLLERVRFLSISASNLDEFYMVRVAGLLDKLHYEPHHLSDDGLTPEDILEEVHDAAIRLVQDQQLCWGKLKRELKKQDIAVISASEISATEEKWLEAYFMENMFPVLTPIAVDPAHPFPFIPNLGITQLYKLKQEGKAKRLVAVIQFPAKLKRFVVLPSIRRSKKTRVIMAEEVIAHFIDALFPSYQVEEQGMIRVVRDSDLEVEEEGKDLVRDFELALKRRRRGRVVRIKATESLPDDLLEMVLGHLEIREEDCTIIRGMVGLAQLSELCDILRPELKYKPFNVRFPERIGDFGGDCFAAIAAKDILVHHPYESFDVVVQFIRQAALDPEVVSIKGTLYRTSHDSPIIAALIEAAESGKSVTAVVELKARFDEEANIRWARDLERAGVQVVYGFVKLKTHSKVTLVTRRTEKGMKSYVHFGTGNYHPSTAKVYTDLSFFTCDEALCRDAASFFNFVTGYAQPKQLQKLVLAPRDLRNTLISHIQQEIIAAKEGKPAHIWAKMNSLVDPQIIDELYLASQAGVKINLIVRGVCALRPQVAGLSENITVKSLVGRFLEHSRIYCFGNGHALPSEHAKVFIGSADWMPRNFDWRVEVMVPIENPTVHAQILNQIMFASLKDDKQSWMLQADGKYQRMPYKEEGFSAHEYFMHNPSLSGRGKALHKAKSASEDLFQLRKRGE
jgi:polyphosphate kinase